MTWKEFVTWAIAQGIRDDDAIGYIDFSVQPTDVDYRGRLDGPIVSLTRSEAATVVGPREVDIS